MTKEGTPAEQTDRKPTPFTELLRAFRGRARLSQKSFGEIVGYKQPSVSRMERGALRPPKSLTFYDSMRGIQGVTDLEIKLLKHTAGVSASADAELPQPIVSINPSANLTISVYAPPEEFDGEDVEELNKFLNWGYEDFVNHRTARNARLSQLDQ